jgi:outer membrane protein
MKPGIASLILVLTLWTAAAPAPAQSPAAAASAVAPVGFVDYDRVFAESRPGRRSREMLEADASRFTGELEGLTREARSIQEDVTRNALTMSEEDRRRRESDISSLNMRFEQRKSQYAEDLEQLRREAVAAMMQRIRVAVARIAQAENFELIVNRAVAVNSGVDITDKVIRSLDAEPEAK